MSLTGDLAETSFSDLVQFYCMSRETVAVMVSSRSGGPPEGVFFVENGEVVDGRFGELVGPNAVREALRMQRGGFRVDRNVKCAQRTVFEPLSKLILEEAGRRDAERNKAAPPDPARRSGPGSARSTQPTPINRATPMALAKVPTPPPMQPVPLPSSNAQAAPATAARRQPVPVPAPPALQQTEPAPPPPGVAAPRGGGKALIAASLALVAAVAVLIAVAMHRTQPEAPRAPVAAVAPAPAAAEPAGPPVNGVTDTEVTFGMVAPFSGAAKELGRSMKTGIEVAFAAANEQGGVNGRRLRLVALDDGYEPTRTAEAMKELLEQRKVFGLIGNVGTPTAAVSVPYALEHKALFFGAFTGAPLLRKDPPDRYVFNYRASYAEETAASVRYLLEVRRLKPEQIAVFAQEDSYGDAGFAGVANTLRRQYKFEPGKIFRVGYKRNTADVDAAVAAIEKAPDVRAVIMVATYRAAAKFIEKLKDKKRPLFFVNVSFVGSSSLAEELMQLGGKYAEGVMVTQVVPLPSSSASAVMHYQDAVRKFAPDTKPDFVSLEGYLAAQVLIEGLRKTGPRLNTESLVNALEGIRGLDVGIGAPLSYGMSEHQASHKVWGTVLDSAGVYRTFDLD